MEPTKMDKNLIKQTQEQIKTIENLFDEIKELQQNRSNFALEKFVVGQHDMPARQRKQVLDELMSMLVGLQQTVTAHEMAQVDIEELSERKDRDKYEQKRNEIRLGEKTREVKLVEMQITGTLRECDYLYRMLQAMPKYTREQFEKEEAEYWTKRLTRQVYLADRGGANMGNLDAVLQMFTEPGKPKPNLPVTLENVTGLIGINGGKPTLKNG